MNKQLFEEMVQKVIVEAKEAMHKVGQKQPGGDTSGDRPVLDSQISSESITIGAVAQQVQNAHDINFYRLLFCVLHLLLSRFKGECPLCTSIRLNAH